MEQAFNSEFYAKLRSLRMSIALSNAAGMSGGRKSKAKGNSVEFSDFREYMLGDDIRRIDWNAYGRFDKLFIKLFMEEKEGLFHVIMDASKSMDFGEKNKAVAAKRLAGAISYIVLENGDRLFLDIMKDGGIETHRGMTGMQAFRKSIEIIDRTEFDGAGDFLSSLKRGNFKQHGMSFFISDGYCDNLEEVFKYLRFCHQEVVFLHVLSPEEKDPAYEGTLQMVDCETGADIRMSMSGSVLRSYKKTFDDFIHNVEALCKKHAVVYIPILSDASVDSLLYGSLSRLATNN